MNTLKIEIPEGFEVDNFDKKTGEVKFKPVPKDIKERIKTFTDVLKYHNIIARDFAHQCSELSTDEAAYRKLKLIVAALNEGWTPDWNNGKWDKYLPWFKMGSPSGVGFSYNDYDDWHSFSFVGSRLCFKSRDLAKYAGNQFEALYKAYFVLN